MDCGSLQTRPRCDTIRVINGRAVCPICGGLTAQRILPGTRVQQLPLYCKRCRQASVVSYEPEPLSLSHD